MAVPSASTLRVSCGIGLVAWLGGNVAPALAAEHPLVLFSQSDLPALRQKIQSEPSATWWSTTPSIADDGLAVVVSRNYLFPGKQYFVIADEVSSADVHDYQWYLHFGLETPGSLEVSGQIVGSMEAPSEQAEVTLRYPGIVRVASDGEPVALVDHGDGFVVFPWAGQHEIEADLCSSASDGGTGGDSGAAPEPSERRVVAAGRQAGLRIR